MLVILLGMGCETVGPMITPWVPALEHVDPTWGEDEVDCEEDPQKRDHPKNTDPSVCYAKSFTCKPGKRFVIEGTTIGGRKNFTDDFWQGAKCTPSRDDYEKSPEAVYLLNLPKHTEAEFRLKSNCANLSPFAFIWTNRGTECPTEKAADSISICEMWPLNSVGDRSKWMKINAIENDQQYLIGVDGQYGAQGNFRLTIICNSYF